MRRGQAWLKSPRDRSTGQEPSGNRCGVRNAATDAEEPCGNRRRRHIHIAREGVLDRNIAAHLHEQG